MSAAEERVEFVTDQRNLTDDELIKKIRFTTDIHEKAVLFPFMQDYAKQLRGTLKVLDEIREERGLEWPEGVRR
jgi:hypothetical protein